MEFVYEGVDRAGKKVSGSMEVNSEGDLRMALRGKGIRPTRIKQGGGSSDITSLLKGGSATVGASTTVPLQLVVTFTRQLQLLVSSGIPLVQGLEVLGEQSQNNNLKQILLTVKDRVSQGTYLWEALSAYPRVFPKLYVALIRAGEASGSLDMMLKRLSKYLEDADRNKQKVKSAMMYPIILILIGIGVIALMLIFVIPKFEEMLKNGNQELPGPTQFVVSLSHFMVNNVWTILAAIVAAVFLVKKYIETEEGAAAFDKLVFNLPIFGNLARKAGIARFARTLQTLLTAGVNLIDAIDICKATIGNAVLESAVSRIRGDIESGQTLGMVLSKLPVFPHMAVQMVLVGESTGNLDKTLDKLAEFFEAEVEILVAGMSKLIEPLLLVFLGGAVGGLMIAMYLPIFKAAGGVD